MPILEVVPIIVAAHLWGANWCRLRVQFLCDNAAVIVVLNSGTSPSSDLMHLLRALARIACLQSFVFSATHSLASIVWCFVVWPLTSIPNLIVYQNFFSACWFLPDSPMLLPFGARTFAFYASCVHNWPMSLCRVLCFPWCAWTSDL